MPGPPKHHLKSASPATQPPDFQSSAASNSQTWPGRLGCQQQSWDSGWSNTQNDQDKNWHRPQQEQQARARWPPSKPVVASLDLPQHLVSLSRALASVLRHQAAKLGIVLDEGGYAKVSDVLVAPAVKKALGEAGLEGEAAAALEGVVEKSVNAHGQARFELKPPTAGDERFIRSTGMSTKKPHEVAAASTKNPQEAAAPQTQEEKPWEPWHEVAPLANSQAASGSQVLIAGNYVDEWKPDNVITIFNETSKSVTITSPTLGWTPSEASRTGDIIRWDKMIGTIKSVEDGLSIEWNNGGKWSQQSAST